MFLPASLMISASFCSCLNALVRYSGTKPKHAVSARTATAHRLARVNEIGNNCFGSTSCNRAAASVTTKRFQASSTLLSPTSKAVLNRSWNFFFESTHRAVSINVTGRIQPATNPIKAATPAQTPTTPNTRSGIGANLYTPIATNIKIAPTSAPFQSPLNPWAQRRRFANLFRTSRIDSSSFIMSRSFYRPRRINFVSFSAIYLSQDFSRKHTRKALLMRNHYANGQRIQTGILREPGWWNWSRCDKVGPGAEGH